ncbi:MAG: amino acid kinase [Chloroflexi bacterium]|nr:MAG: amino acid kinase [Chloroflexota bacterium]
MSQHLTILKLGGALLTDKKRPFSLRQSTLNQVAHEIKVCLDAGLINQLILVHGVGSFGHPPVLQHKLHQGFQSPEQLIHLTETQNKVFQLRLAIAEALHQAGIAVSTILPSSSMSASGAVLKNSYLDAVAGFLDLGMVPLLGGDVLVDNQMGFCVYGGDKIGVDLALHFGASHLVFATEVDGIFDKDPHKHERAQLIEELSLGNMAAANMNGQQVDASGSMGGKLTAVLPTRDAINDGLQVHVLSMVKQGNLLALLQGERSVGTRIVM